MAEFMESVKVDLFPNEVYIFTPKGDVRPFPIGPLPLTSPTASIPILDIIVQERGERKDHPLRYELHSGDTVEIVTSPNQKPSKDWLKYVKTSRAKTKIRQWFAAEEREKSIALGKDILEKELHKYDLRWQNW